MTTPTDDNKKVALVTGATGLLGQVICRRLAAEGVHLGLGCTSNEAAANTLAAELSQDFGIECSVHPFDVKSAGEVQAAVTDLAERHGRVDILVAAHGVAPQQFLRFTREEDVQSAFRVNAEGTIHCVTAVLPHMQQNNFGRVVLLGTAAVLGRLRSAVYSASKSALEGLVRSASLEHAAHGITFNIVSPAVVEGGPATIGDGRDKLLKDYPLGRFILPEEVAGTIAFLTSEAAASITGQQIIMDGGRP